MGRRLVAGKIASSLERSPRLGTSGPSWRRLAPRLNIVPDLLRAAVLRAAAWHPSDGAWPGREHGERET